MKKLLFLLLLVPSLAFAQIQPGEPYYAMTTQNTDIRGMVERIDRHIFEIGMSASSRVSDVSAADRKRIDDFNAALIRYRDVVVSLPVIDAPSSHPMELTISYVTETFEKEMFNLGLRDLVALYAMMSIELTGSQSSELASGLLDPDLARFDTLMQRIQLYLTSYLDQSKPADVPENRVYDNQQGRGGVQ